jgi:hypothetical protein
VYKTYNGQISILSSEVDGSSLRNLPLIPRENLHGTTCGKGQRDKAEGAAGLRREINEHDKAQCYGYAKS